MNFSFRKRSVFGLTLVFALLFAALGATSYLFSKQTYYRQMVEHTLNVQTDLTGILSLLQDGETGQRGYLLTGRESYLEPYQRASLVLDHAFENLAGEIADNQNQSRLLEELRATTNKRFAILSEGVELKRRGDTKAAVGIVLSNRGKILMDRARAIINEMKATETRLLQTRQFRAQRAHYWTQFAIGVVLLIALILGAMTTLDIRRQFKMLHIAHADLRDEVARREKIETQLRQAQKMEAIGQLTGGIAHDFNNMLAVVIGNLNLVRRRVERGEDNILNFVNSALEGAQRAAALTHSLLAFSRQQPLAPQPVDVNRLVSGMAEIIRRTIGETIGVETVLAGGAWPVHSDKSQLESALLNLALNARDAMKDGGKLTIETLNASLDDAYAAQHVGVMPGQYTLLSVTDTGCGMSADVVARAFEPFFTTKEIGKGTGLGLSQVMGFVKQSGGHIKIYSEPGHGTAIKIYMPRYRGDGGSQTDDHFPEGDLPQGTAQDVVLVVEDEERMLAFSSDAFRELGYTVHQANTVTQAMRLVEAHPEITLLFTDVVMPEMNGRKFAEAARQKLPHLKVIYTTGFSRNAIIHNNVLDSDVNFLAKPFTIEQLALKAHAVLTA